MPKPDGNKEDFGITVLDEPALNHTDPSVLEMKYLQTKDTGKRVQIDVRSIENAEKNPKDVQNWIKNVNELHKNRPPATIQYSKVMPDIDKLMEEWPPAIENLLKDIPFPGPDIDMSPDDYAKAVLAMLDIPVHKGADNKGIIEGLHVMFTLFSTFKENQHFQKQQQQQVNQERDGDQDFMSMG
jgi:intraflagellar transport protein 46